MGLGRMWPSDSHGSRVPGDREALHAVDVRGLGAQVDLLGRYGQAQGGEAGDQRGERDPHLDAGELLAQALVDAVAEGQVPGGLPVDVERVGVGEALRVAVGGVVRQDDRRAGLDGLAAQLDVLQRRPRERSWRRSGTAAAPPRPGRRAPGRRAGRPAASGLLSRAKVPRASMFAVVSSPAASRSSADTRQLLVGQVGVGAGR